MTPIYLHNTEYENLIDGLSKAFREGVFTCPATGQFDADRLKIALGELGDIWPKAIEPKVLPFPANVPQMDCYIAVQHTRRKMAGAHHLMVYAIA